MIHLIKKLELEDENNQVFDSLMDFCYYIELTYFLTYFLHITYNMSSLIHFFYLK